MSTEATTPAADAELPAGTIEEQVTWIVSLITGHEAEIADHAAEAKKHAAEIDSLKAQLRELLPVGKHTYGNSTVTIANPARSFDAKAFMASYPVEMNPALYKAVIDTAALPPKLKDQFMAAGTGDPKVTVK